MNSDSQSVFDYIFNLIKPGIKLELSRVVKFMEILGNPHICYPVIHIAGTNGKGSTAAMLGAILNAYGIKTGLFTSPHLVRPNERIRIGQVEVPDDFIICKVKSWQSDIDKLGITFFEVLTALGMVYFKEQQVEYAVIETGLGGRFDATNVVDPELSIITAVSMDHENILGHNIEQIAAEKAGIIKKTKPVILARNPSQVRQVIESKCNSEQTTCTYVPDLAQIMDVKVNGTSQLVQITINNQIVELKLPLLGVHQVENFCNVLVSLQELGFELDTEKIQVGLDSMHWGGRMQVLQSDPLVLYDVAHNPEGLERLMESLKQAGLGDCIMIAAFNARKNIGRLLAVLGKWSGVVLYTNFEGHSAVGAAELVPLGVDPDMILENPERVYAHALTMRTHADQAICFFGSHYLAEDLFTLFKIST